MRKKKEKKTIGRTETVDFPELNISGIEAKVDTGAYTSAIHCTNIRIENRDGEKTLCFEIFTHGNEEESLQERCFQNYKRKRIKNSFGHIELRYIIKTRIKLFQHDYPIELSLADRTKMKYPVLLGRKMLYKRFIVDVSRKNLSGK